MKNIANLERLLKSGMITNELDLERALIIDRKLRLLAKDDPELSESRKSLRSLIRDYEQSNWSKESVIDESKLKESDTAVFIAEQEEFSMNRGK